MNDFSPPGILAPRNPNPFNNDIHVVVSERDCLANDALAFSPRPVVFETNTDTATLDSAKARQKELGNRFGETRIAKLVFLNDKTPPENGWVSLNDIQGSRLNLDRLAWYSVEGTIMLQCGIGGVSRTFTYSDHALCLKDFFMINCFFANESLTIA